MSGKQRSALFLFTYLLAPFSLPSLRSPLSPAPFLQVMFYLTWLSTLLAFVSFCPLLCV